ncbi:ABC transporter ATP-binding protein [Pseudonocardia sp. RS010]|uniref:ABC transporter ATP-binding protein n=1 Tax=Pseudonocardia sp. RS010 TaxID=3385979 RepID=UPI0039A099CE
MRQSRAAGSKVRAESDTAFIGVEDLETPYYLKSQLKAAQASVWAVARETPRTAAILVQWAWRASRPLTIATGLIQLVAAATTALGLLATTEVFAQLLSEVPSPERIVAALPALVAVVTAVAGRGLLDAAAGLLTAELTPRIEQRAEDELYSGLIHVDLIAFDDPDFTELVRRNATQAVLRIRVGVQMLGNLISAAVTLVAAVVTAGVLHPILVPLVLLAGLPHAWASVRSQQANLASMVALNSDYRRRAVTGQLISERDNAAEVRAFTAQTLLLGEHRRISATVTRGAIQLGRRQNRITTTGRALSGLATGIGFIVLGLLVYTGWLPLALAGTAVVSMQRSTLAILNSVFAINGLFEVGVHVDLFRACLDDIQTRRRSRGNESLNHDPAQIQVSAVSFRYPGQESDALHEINLMLRRGEIVALVGENGSGKTTLAKLLTGLYLPTDGEVLWDGIPTSELDANDLHERVAVVMQDPLRWPVTAENNIRIGRFGRDDPNDAVFADSASRSGADAVLAQLPHGRATILSREFQGGRDLSGGQWQRLSVARGLYRDAGVVVADEPTAAMDARAEHAVFAALRSISTARASQEGPQERITVLVTHRLANVRHADQIVVMEHGRITELGTHDQLMRRAGTYHELYTLQARAYTSDASPRLPV